MAVQPDAVDTPRTTWTTALVSFRSEIPRMFLGSSLGVRHLLTFLVFQSLQVGLSVKFIINVLIDLTSAGSHSHRDRRRNRNSHPSTAISSHLFSPFGIGLGANIMDDFFNVPSTGGFTSFSSFNGSFTNGANGAANVNMKRMSTSTKFINGKKITTKK